MRIALVGSAPSSIGLAPWQDESFTKFTQGKVHAYPASPHADERWEMWGCSPGAYGQSPRFTAWFEVHRWEPGKPWFSPEYCQFLREFRGPVYTGGEIPEIKNHVRYPLEEVETEFSSYFLTSSLSLMAALAILEIEKARKSPGHDPADDVIGFFGVDMSACPHPDTKVLTADLRWVRAGDLKVGDKLIAFDEETVANGDSTPKRYWRTSEVLRASQITKPCYRIYFEDGTTQVCSDEHMWLTHAENHARWKMTKDLVTPHHREGRPTRVIKLCDTWEEDRSWDAGYLAAAFDGEGHITQKRGEDDYGLLRIGFAQRENAMSAEVLAACERMGFELGQDSTDGGMNGDCIKYSIRGGRSKTMEFLGRVRPRRLLEKFSPEFLGIMQKQSTVAVERIEFLGEQPVVGLKTSTATFIAEGLASHNTEEYGYQRAGCQHFILNALERGIGVYVPPESDLLRPMPVYGMCEWDHNYIKLTARARELNNRIQAATERMSKDSGEIAHLRGAMDDLNYMTNTWTTPYGLPSGQVIIKRPENLRVDRIG